MKKKISEQLYKKLLFEAMQDDYGDTYKGCNNCGKPTHVMYVCRHCGSEDP